MKAWGFLLRWGTAAIAAAVSAAFAATLSADPNVTYVLVALSIGCVLIEAHSLGWARARRREGDHFGAGLCAALLVMACVYTAGMQLGFFGNVLMAPASADKGAHAALTNAETRVKELETAGGWLVRPAGSVKSLQQLVDSYKGQKKLSSKDADALRQAKADLAAAQGAVEHDNALQAARAAVAQLKGEAPKDVKGQVFAWLSRGMLQGDATTFGFILLAVVVMQFAQIVLPIATGLHSAPGGGGIKVEAKPEAPAIAAPETADRLAVQSLAAAIMATPVPAPAPQPEGPPPPQVRTPAPKRFSERVKAAKAKKAPARKSRAAATRFVEPPYDLPVNPNVVPMRRPTGFRANIRKVG